MRITNTILKTLVVVIMAILVAACTDHDAGNHQGHNSAKSAQSDKDDQQINYTCPMHPHFISTDPDGSCPICGMDLVPAASADEPQAQMQMESSANVAEDQKPTSYTCPMHPHYISTDPDGSCPICGMDLVPVIKASENQNKQPQLRLSPAITQTIGVKTSPAAITQFAKTLRAFGSIQANERLESVSVARVEGWIETMSVTAEGEVVEKGDELYRVYSPDLLSAQNDYLAALRTGSKSRIGAVAQRLESLGMQSQTVRKLASQKSAIREVPIYAEASGNVVELSIRQGDYIKPGTPILRLQSFDSVWIIASIPETDLPLVRSDATAELSFPSAPEQRKIGQVDYIYPTIDPVTRTGKVRIQITNTEGDLLPGAYADVRFKVDISDRLSVPSEAVLRDSRGQHVIIALGEGQFESRTVRTGLTTDGNTEILSGLDAGENVVTSSQFMLDSEVKLREGLSKLAPASNPRQDDGFPELDSRTLALVDHFVDASLYLHERLVEQKDINNDFLEPAINIGNTLKERADLAALRTIISDSQAALLGVQNSNDHQQKLAHYAALLEALKPWLLQGHPQHYKELGLALYQHSGNHQIWLQRGGEVRNPYGAEGSIVIPWPKKSVMNERPMPSGHRH